MHSIQALAMTNLGLGSYHEWLHTQKASVFLLREALKQPPIDQELLPLVQACYSNYKDYSVTKIKSIQANASFMASATWKSPLEAGFLWIGGWRPTTAVVLAYSLMSTQIENELGKILEGIDVPSMAALSARQLSSLNTLHIRTRHLEDDLSDRLALIQMLVADQQMVKATTVDPPPSETNDLSEIWEAIKPKLLSLRDLIVEAEQLRSKTAEEMLMILTPTQAAQFTVAAFEMFLVTKKLAEHQYILYAGLQDLGLRRDADVAELASEGEVILLQETLQQGANPSEVDYDGRAAPHMAAEKGHLDCVTLLITVGVNINEKEKYGSTPLIGALNGGHDAVAQVFTENGAEAQMQGTGMELCKATASGDVEYLERLARHGADPNAIDCTHSTALCMAGIFEAVEILGSKGPDVLATNWRGSIPLDEARQANNEATVRTLEQHRHGAAAVMCPKSTESLELVDDSRKEEIDVSTGEGES